MAGTKINTQLYVAAPSMPTLLTGSVLGVWINPDEEVTWIYSYDGKSIIGYTITKRAG